MTNRPGPDPEVDDREILQILVDAYPPALGTGKIAERLPITTQATAKHLKRMRDEGLVDSDKAGRALIWWITDDGKRYLAGIDSDQ